MEKLIFIFAIVCLGSCKKQTTVGANTAGMITTIAGDDSTGYSGDGGPATKAELSYPAGVAVDGGGNVYIADYNNNCIREVNSLGIISTIAGNRKDGYSGDGGKAIDAELSGPLSIAVDGNGNIYVADVHNSCIRKITLPGGIISTIAGNGVDGYSGDGGMATAAKLSSPSGVAIDGNGNIYIADQGDNCIRKVNAAGIISLIAGTPGISSFGYSGDGGPATAARLFHPYGVAVDGGGNVFISDTRNRRIRKVNPAGTISTVAGTGADGFSNGDGVATAVALSYPEGMAVDGNGNVYFADDENGNVRIITPSGRISTIAGNGMEGYNGDARPAVSASLNEPEGVAADGFGNVYIADNTNQRIRKVTK